MKNHLTRLQLCFIVFAGILLVTIYMDSMWSVSVDLAHHYALAYRIAEDWTLPNVDPSLGEMSHYPRISHTLAAIVGLIFNSTFIGLQLVSLASLAVLWGAVIAIVCTLPWRAAIISLIGMVCLFVANRAYAQFELHGSELVGNFFYSQLVAQAVVMATLALAIYLEVRKSHAITIIILLTAIAYITTSIHLMPALELLGVIAGLAFINNVISKNCFSQKGIKSLILHLFVVMVAISAVLMNPAFREMRKLSENNGELTLRHISNTHELALLCLFVLAIAGVLLSIWIKNNDRRLAISAAKYLGLYGISISLLCLAQIAALHFGYGSEYATKKYAFALFTYSSISISIFMGIYIDKWLPENVASELLASESTRTAIIVIAFTFLFICSLPEKKGLDTSDVVSLEHQLINLRDVALQSSGDRSNVVIGLQNMNNTINYMFSIAVAKTPMPMAIQDVLVSNSLLDIGKYESIVTSVNSRPYYRSACKRFPSAGALAVLDAACVANAMKADDICTGFFDFTFNGYVDPAIISGFSEAENHGRWTDESKARFSCIIQGKEPKKVKIFVTPFLYGTHNTQRLSVRIDSTENEYQFDSNSGRIIEIALPKREVGEKLNIDFNMPDAISPKQLGLSIDARMLGVSVKTISFE